VVADIITVTLFAIAVASVAYTNGRCLPPLKEARCHAAAHTRSCCPDLEREELEGAGPPLYVTVRRGGAGADRADGGRWAAQRRLSPPGSTPHGRWCPSGASGSASSASRASMTYRGSDAPRLSPPDGSCGLTSGCVRPAEMGRRRRRGYARPVANRRAIEITVMWQRAVGQMTCVCRKGANLLACGSASVGTPSRRGKEHVLASTTSACARGQGQADAPPWQRPPMLTGSTSS
jgi:hypothetical protein